MSISVSPRATTVAPDARDSSPTSDDCRLVLSASKLALSCP
jgi:hypothetical protein